MRLSTAQTSLVALLAAGLVQSQYLINELSFGYNGQVKSGGSNDIPNFTLQGQPGQPQLLSNKLILTPVAPGNARGSIWSQNRLTHDTWTADVEFRASGPERGGGNLQIWLVRDGDKIVQDSSIYTVGRFDGLALVVDAHGGSGGMLRGFLNDGSMDYKQHHNIDELAFGHCKYSYRNLGRPSQIKLRQAGGTFKVEIDNRLCFETDKINIPAGNFFGLTAATPETPDSFEIFKLVVMSETGAGGYINNEAKEPPPPPPPSRQSSSKPPITDQERVISEDFDDGLPDEDADIFQTSKQQFQDLHNRLQSSTHQLSAIFRTVNKHHQMDEKRQSELRELFAELKTEFRAEIGKSSDSMNELQRRIKDLEKEMRGIRNDLGKKIQANERVVKSYLTDHHATLSQTVLDSMPRHRTLALMFIGAQLVLVVAYFLYKKRKSAGAKKYL
jgi:mannose-binding lectin 1